jgi:hypothetical protein
MESMSWQEQYKGAEAYLRRVQKNRSTFSPDLIYNLCAMAIEQYFMALCVFKDILPENHRFSDLIYSVSSFTTLTGTIIENLNKMETMQEICSLEGYNRRVSSPDDVPFYISTTEEIREFAVSLLPIEA